MISALLRKWFGLDPISCETCEILREQLAKSDAERRELLHKLLDKDKPDSSPIKEEEEYKPITPSFTPWRVRQQMLEAEDRKKAQLTKEKEKEISELEKELDIVKEPDRGESGGVKFHEKGIPLVIGKDQ